MQTTDTIIIGGGQAGLAASRGLADLGHDHVVLERGRVAERWTSQRWDSLRLLTPNWMTRLPGFRYEGPQPNGFMRAAETATFLRRYASSFDAPVRQQTTVERVHHDGVRFVVGTDDGALAADTLVIATGWCDRPAIPAAARHLSRHVHQIVPSDYRNPSDLPPGGVLVVGASATGVQLAEEFRAAGHDVTLAVGSHMRLPRRYRGMDIFWWLDVIGAFDRTIEEVGDPVAARLEPSVQLVGRADHRTLDLAALQHDGVRLAGRLRSIDGTRVTFGADLPTTVAAAEYRMTSQLARIDRAIERLGLSQEVCAPEPLARVATSPAVDALDLDRAGIRSVVWATGFHRSYDWLDLPILDAVGEIRQVRGVTAVPGAYVLGQRFQHRRNSNFIDGVGRDARYVVDHIARNPRPLRRTPVSQPMKR